jgi:hypothetical protein
MPVKEITKAMTPDEELMDLLSGFYADPLGYVMFAFPWDSDTSLQVVRLAEGVAEILTDDDRKRQAEYRARFPDCEWGPDLWACDFLTELGEEIKKRRFDGHTPCDPIRFATVSGHEIGKSVCVAWLIKFIMDTRPMSKGSVTAVTDEQLRTKTWAELGKWHYVSITEHLFNYTTGRGAMSLSHKNPKWAGAWRTDARTCREEKSEAFAGQHAPTATSFYIFDEGSGVPDKVYEVREGGLTSGEPMVFDFGNGTRNSGTFYENCVGKFSERYIVRSIDSRTVKITNKKKIADDLEFYDEDSDFFRSRWRGLFPQMGLTQFIGSDVVDLAMARPVPDTAQAPLVLGVDVARFGDDRSVIWPRKGDDARSWPVKAYSGLDTVQLTAQIVAEFKFFEGMGQRPAMVFVDEGNMGAGIVDNLRHLGYPVMGINFGGKAAQPMVYRYKIDEMWGSVRDALNLGRLCLPERGSEHGQTIYNDLTQREFGYTLAGKISLEPKADMKARGLPSPDFADALVITYGSEVASILPDTLLRNAGQQVTHEYDPYAEMRGDYSPGFDIGGRY